MILSLGSSSGHVFTTSETSLPVREAAFRGPSGNSQPAQEEEAAAAAIRTRFRSLQRSEADILLRKRLGGQKKEKKKEENKTILVTMIEQRPLGLVMHSLAGSIINISPPHLSSEGQADRYVSK